ncbi:hypothetical protein KCM76_24375 [Zooshikella marina]|uniref:hypothetical protein n=1 Tax=Zooshikella ganghwensis TaxID=202772 RepID=UPI001BAF77CF|nr:hypothetical protein [Zooshikella ganghwensis]MBU2709154.1 hypothetical protein [Zooshikella ganghwensis]
MNRKIITILLITTIIEPGIVHSTENKFVNHVIDFDKAQSKLSLQKVIPYLSDKVYIKIKTCKNSIDIFDMERFKRTFLSIQQHAELLSINREVTKIEDCDNGFRCTIYSKLKERVVAYQGKYDKTTISNDITVVEKIGESLKISSINGEILCK